MNETSKCVEQSKCLGEKEINIGKNVTECFFMSNKTQYLHEDGWKSLLIETESFDVVAKENRVLLKVHHILHDILHHL